MLEVLDQWKSIEDREKSEFKIRWVGHGPDKDTWECEDNLANNFECAELLKAFWGERRRFLDGGLKGGSSSSSSSSGSCHEVSKADVRATKRTVDARPRRRNRQKTTEDDVRETGTTTEPVEKRALTAGEKMQRRSLLAP